MNSFSWKVIGYHFLVICIFAFYNVQDCCAQENIGSGVWLGTDLKYGLSKKVDLNFSTELRTITGPIQFGSLLFETGIDFDATKHFTTSAFYRLDVKPDALQHRVYIDLAFDQKVKKKITTELRLRIQREYQLNKIPDNYLRPKLSFKYKLNKKVTPVISGELFYHYYYKAKEFDDFRFEAGLNYDLKKGMSLKPFYLMDMEFNVVSPGLQHIAGITFGKDW